MTGVWIATGGGVVFEFDRLRAAAWCVILVCDFARDGTAGMQTSFEWPENGSPGDSK